MHFKMYRAVALHAVAALSLACPGDTAAPSGTLRLIQAEGRVGEEQDGLGALVVGQALCGTDVCLYGEGGTIAYRGEIPQAKLCLPLPGRGAVRDFELAAFPAHTAMTLHSELLLNPASCKAPLEPCTESCKGLENAEKSAPLVVLDQSTLVVRAVLAEPAEGTSSGSGEAEATTSSSTGSATGSDSSTSLTSSAADTTTTSGGSTT